MILSGDDIKNHLEWGKIDISPFDPALVQPASYDLTLGWEFVRLQGHSSFGPIDPMENTDWLEGNRVRVPLDGQFHLQPGEFALASTWETVGVDNSTCARIDGKSSLARLGLIVHATAGFIDPGFYGEVTLELSNLTKLPIILRPQMPICQISFSLLLGDASTGYGDKKGGAGYQGQVGPVLSRYYKNFEKGE